MRRKVLQDFANVFCQRFIDLPSGYDLASLVHCGSGIYNLDILNGDCTRDGSSIPSLATCREYREWLVAQQTKHNVPPGIAQVSMRIDVLIRDIRVKTSYGHVFSSAHFDIDCCSEIRTEEKTYTGHQRGAKAWGFDWYYQKLYGSPIGLPGAVVEHG